MRAMDEKQQQSQSEPERVTEEPVVVPGVVPVAVPAEQPAERPQLDEDALADVVERADITEDDGTGDPDDEANLSAEGY